MSSYEVRHYDTSGNLLNIFTESRFSHLEFVRSENAVGALELIMPKKDLIPGDINKCEILEVWKDGGLLGETAYFILDWEFASNEGEELVAIMAKDANWLLSTRIVAYAAGSAQAEMTYEADQMMRAIFVDNFRGDAIAARRLLDVDFGALLENGESLTKGFSRRNVLKVMQEICEAGTEAGTRTYFDVVRVGTAKFEFRTYTGQRGVDHGASSNDIRLVGAQYQNFDDIVLGFYYSEEENYIYAGGQGQESEREVVEVSDSVRIANGYPFNRCEGWADARQCETTACITSEGNAKLGEKKPRMVLTGQLIETEGMQYNVHYKFGDVVSAEAFGYKLDCHIRSIKVTVDGNIDRVSCRLYGET